MTNATTVAQTVATKPRRTTMNILSWMVEDWYWFCQVASLILLGATVMLGAGALFTGNVLNKRQALEIETLKHDIMVRGLPRWARLSKLDEYVEGKISGVFEVVFVPENDEANRTALGIEGSLSASGKWKVFRNARPVSEEEKELVLPQYATPEMAKNPFHAPLITRVGLISDITVIASEQDMEKGFPKDGTAIHVLWKGLHSCGFQTIAVADSRLPSGTARIVVGAKE